MKSIFLKLILLTLLNSIFSEIYIAGPKELRKVIGDNIPHKWGNFGKIPYGKTITGRIYWNKEAADNTFCDPLNLPKFNTKEIFKDTYSPIFLVDR